MVFEDTQTEGYQKSLAGGNVGVVLGASSNDLCAIDIDDDQDIEPFLEINPALRKTLISRGARGVQIWVRCEKDPQCELLGMQSYPKLYGIKFKDGVRDKISKTNPQNRQPGQFGEWRSDGGQSIVYGRHPAGHDYTFKNAAAVISIRFRDIRWPIHIVRPWEHEIAAALIERYGDPWVPDRHGMPNGMNELYYAGMFAFHNYIIYENDEERYYLYNGSNGLWERAKEEDVHCRISDMLLKASRAQNQPILGTMRFRSSAKMGRVSSFLKGLAGKRGIFNRRRGIVHLQNGMLDLMSVDQEDPSLCLLPFSPDYYSRNQIPVRFDSEADCVKFKDSLLARALKKDDVVLMQRWAGLLLLQENIYQKIMILTGTAGAGKSTIMSVLQKIVGQDNCAQLRTEQLLERFEMAAFIGKSTLVGADVPGNFLMQRGAYKLKQLTGGDFFQAEIKTARDLVTLCGNYNVGITCNSRLRINMDSDAGAWDRRLLIGRCDGLPPKEKIPNFDLWLIKQEGSGIVNWMIEGALDILNAGKFEMSDAHIDAVRDLLEESDSVRSFLRRCVIASQNKEDNVTSEELIEAYHEFCDNRGWDAVTAKTLEKQLPNLMLELYRVNKSNNVKRDDKARRGYQRVKIVEPTDEEHIYNGEA